MLFASIANVFMDRAVITRYEGPCLCTSGRGRFTSKTNEFKVPIANVLMSARTVTVFIAWNGRGTDHGPRLPPGRFTHPVFGRLT